MRKIVKRWGFLLLGAPLLLAGCTGGAPAFPNLGILKREAAAPTLSADEQKKTIAELEAEQKKNKAAQSERR